MKKVLLLIDQKVRDQLSVMLIGEYLKTYGLSVYYCNKGNMLAATEKYKPDVFVMSCSEGQFKELAQYIAPRCKIVLMTQEGACATKESTVMRHTFQGLGNGCYLEGLSRVYLWSEISRHWLLEKAVYPEEIIRVYGTSRLDPYRIANAADVEQKRKFRVGFANRGAVINLRSRTNPIFDLEQVRAKVGPHRAYLDKNREWEDWIWHSIASMRVNLNLVEILNSQYDIVWRPDPFEDPSSYGFLAEKYPGFVVNSDPVLMNFIDDIDVLVTEFSTTGTEALMLKKPVISTQKLLGDRLRDHNNKPNHINPEHTQFYWQPSTEQEFIEILSALKKGKLPYSPMAEDAEKYINRIYGWRPDSTSVAYLIAQDIKTICETNKSPELQALHQREFAEHPLFLRLSTRFSLPLSVIKKIFARPLIFDLFYLWTAFRQGRFLLAINIEYLSWYDAKLATKGVKDMFRKLQQFDKHILETISFKTSRDVHGKND